MLRKKLSRLECRKCISPKLEAFLLEKKVMGKFVKNMYKEGKYTHSTIYFISSPFTWGRSPEGYSFWDKLDMEFRTLV